MNKHAMHDMVEYIKLQAEFPFDALDVEESLETVLSYFGFHPQIDAEEREQLIEDLLPLGLSAELAEMQHLAEADADSAIGGVRKPQEVWLHVLGRQPKSVTPAQFMEELRLV